LKGRSCESWVWRRSRKAVGGLLAGAGAVHPLAAGVVGAAQPVCVPSELG
jgi:hypothetical protein